MGVGQQACCTSDAHGWNLSRFRRESVGSWRPYAVYAPKPLLPRALAGSLVAGPIKEIEAQCCQNTHRLPFGCP